MYFCTKYSKLVKIVFRACIYRRGVTTGRDWGPDPHFIRTRLIIRSKLVGEYSPKIIASLNFLFVIAMSKTLHICFLNAPAANFWNFICQLESQFSLLRWSSSEKIRNLSIFKNCRRYCSWGYLIISRFSNSNNIYTQRN